MSEIDIIIPVKDESENIEEIVKRIQQTMDLNGISYSMIFVDDYSSDDTVKKIQNLSKKYPIRLKKKSGQPGKAFSILEGAQLAESEMVAMIDGDLQYPPEAIPEMLSLARFCGIVVANRKIYETTFLREIASKINRLIFGRLLMGLKCDVQSGLKVFKKEIINYIDEAKVTPWTLDIHIIHTALELGYRVGSVDIYFQKRKQGKSKIDFSKAALEIASNTIKLRFRNNKIYQLKPTNSDPSFSAGLAFKRRRFITHTNLSHEETAFYTLKFWQKIIFLGILALLITGFIVNLKISAIAIIAILSSVYFIDVIFSLILLLKSLHFPPEITFAKKDLENLKDEDLPVYSILCPLYREAEIVPHFIKALDEIDWPKDRLDVILLLEEDDHETVEKVQSINLPSYARIFVVPYSYPKTKPKACNFGLVFAKGEFVVIYDAEDRPDPLQLKKAFLAFKKGDEKLFCLQSKLNYYNPNHNLLTKLFTAEYSLWFDIILQGIQSIESTIPLGGTSNHFRTLDLRKLQGWDPFNVTEDCDLGVRIFKKGFKTAIIDSTTYEEANSSVPNWLRQRSRWIKGYFQTYFVHMRQPLKFLKRQGLHMLLFQLITGIRMSFMLINPFLWLATISYFALRSLVGTAIEALYPGPVFYMAVTSLVFGNFMYVYNYMIGCAKRKHWSLVKYVFLIPLYWLMASVASYIAIYQLIVKPHYWEKTHHGLHLALKKVEHKKARSLIGRDLWDENFPRLWDLTGVPIVNLIRQAAAYLKSRVKISFSYFVKFIKDTSDSVRTLISNTLPDFNLIFSINNNGAINLNKLKILILNWRDTKHLWAGGAEVYLHELAKRWVEAGHEVTLFCGNDKKQPRYQVIDGVKIVRRGGFYTVYIWAFLYYLFRFRNHIDVVIESENGVPFFTPLYVRKPKFLIAYHVHQEVFRKYLTLPLSAIARFAESTLMPLVYQNQKVITISHSSKEDFKNLGFTNEENIEVVIPGVDTKKYKTQPKTDYPSFIYLGRHKPYKNIDIAIKAFAKLLGNRPQSRLTIAGEGESTQDLVNLTSKLKIQKNVDFVGKVSEQEKARLFAQSWAALQPSSIEGWGLTVIEANASGTPVIASNARGLRESIVHGETGLLTATQDANAMAEAMNWITAYPAQRLALSRQAHVWSRQFHWDIKADEFLKIVQKELLQRKELALIGEPFAPDKVRATLYKSL